MQEKENKNNTGFQAGGLSLSSEHLEGLSRKEDHKCKVSLSYWLSSRPARDMDQESGKKKKEKGRRNPNKPILTLIDSKIF